MKENIRLRDCCVVFTATVRPTIQSVIAGTEEQREAEYVEAISSTMEAVRNRGLSARFILAENSAAEVTRLRKTCDEYNIQFLRCPSSPALQFKGKGHAEALLLIHTVNTLSATAMESCCFLKITGRLQLCNIEAILRSIAKSSCDCLINLYVRSQYADTRVMAFNRNFLQYVSRFIEEIDDANGKYLEYVMPVAMRMAVLNGLKADYLLPPPRLKGRSASTGETYRASWSQYIAEYLKVSLYRQTHALDVFDKRS